MRLTGREATWRRRLAGFLLAAAGVAGAARGNVLGADPVAGQPSLAGVLADVTRIRAELELIRFEMGKPRNEQPEIDVEDAALHEVYFQALTLLRKANRLSFEQTRSRPEEPQTPDGVIGVTEVSATVGVALERVRRVKEELGIADEAVVERAPASTSPTEVFRSIVQANRQINLLLDREFSPSDVFQQVTVAVGYAARLLGRFPETTRIPPAPPRERGKTPSDVYRRLIGCYERIRAIAAQSGLEMARLRSRETDLESITPSDVYDIASLIVSELAYLHSQLKGARRPRGAYDPGRKFPSHVFQRVGILEAQLIRLEELVAGRPDWLRS